MEATAITAAITGGEFSPEEVNLIKQACTRRREMDGLSLLPGTRVIVNDDVRPTYLQRKTGVTGPRRGQRIEVTFDDCYDSRVAGKNWRMTPTSIRAIEGSA